MGLGASGKSPTCPDYCANPDRARWLILHKTYAILFPRTTTLTLPLRTHDAIVFVCSATKTDRLRRMRMIIAEQNKRTRIFPKSKPIQEKQISTFYLLRLTIFLFGSMEFTKLNDSSPSLSLCIRIIIIDQMY